MNIGKISALSVIVLILAISIVSPPTSTSPEAAPRGPWVDKIIIFEHGTEDTAVPMIEKDEMTLWFWWLRKYENIKAAEESPDVKTLKVWGTWLALLVNPLETEEGFNPFSIREVREALNWLIDREYIAMEILKGLAIPRWTIFRAVSPDYSRVIDYMKILESKYAHNFEKAKEAIFNALLEAGAVYKEGKWYYEDEPITIKFLIRPEDERKDIGDYIATLLEKLGFTVERLYKPAAEAYMLWGSVDPTLKGEWHLYTAGWISLAITAYDDSDPYYYYSEWSVPWIVYHKVPPILAELADKLNKAEYKSIEERNEWVKKITELALQDGTYIFLADQKQIYIISADVEKYVYDLYGGACAAFWIARTIRFAEPGGEVKAGNRVMFIEGFNPVGGFGWLYDELARQMFMDFGVWAHPHTGRYIPIRAQFKVETAGPDGKLPVPSDALKYDVTERKFVPVGPGVEATSKVTFDLVLGKWHHGQPITKADILHGIAMTIRYATEGTEVYDPNTVEPAEMTFVRRFKAIRFVDEDTVEVYIDYWHVDETYIAAMADIWPVIPWELHAIMADVVAEKKAAFSLAYADEWGVEMLDLTKGPTLSLLEEALKELSAENYIPPELEDVITAEDAKARWDALNTWYTEKGHFMVSNGPFYFEKADPVARQIILSAFREYPFTADKWDELLIIKVPEAEVVKAPTEVVPGMPAEFDIQVTVAGKAYERAKVKYLVTDPLGRFTFSGAGEHVGGGLFKITFSEEDTAKLMPGTYKMTLITVGEEAATPKLIETTFTVIPEIAYFEKLVKGVEARVTTVEGSVSSLSDEISSLRSEIEALRGQIGTLTTISVISIVIAIAALVVAFIRRPK
ncbi:MAG: hypothetical protein DRN53_00305 [Thermoprotei archaeon]|nr:MAG: hypothetical protein DRN53_00305 [Thermoprotei archaeon]